MNLSQFDQIQMKLYVITETWCNYKEHEYNTKTLYFVSEYLAICTLEELHNNLCEYAYDKKCQNDSCDSDNCKKCYYECCMCGRIKDTFEGMDRCTLDVYDKNIYATVIDLNEIENKNTALSHPEYDTKYT